MKKAKHYKHPVEIWGGVECSVVRTNETVHDQLKMNGHEERPDDLRLFAELGITTLRYPLLWEKYASQKELFFELHDERLKTMQELNITPVAGLLHHGSGPFDTDLMQSDFPSRLADYAATIARRYPWIEYYTPVNEPLTTARFSGLYGIWYPHKKDDYHFAHIFLNELKGIILSMKKIREINPKAKLVQTEDIAKVHSTRLLEYQAELENERTWLTYDILTGKFGPQHTFWNYFIDIGISEKELNFFTKEICPPDICGFNYYVTSERFLDHRTSDYPDIIIGGNDVHDYADIEAVRVSGQKLTGIESLLREAALRYNLPVALTEIHLACTREEQIRWFDEAYQATLRLHNEGFDIRAITAWSLLGSFDWNSLLQVKGEYYESGVFDIRSGKPRPTALAELIRTYNDITAKPNELTAIPGWWNRNVRIRYQVPPDLDHLISEEYGRYSKIRPVLIFGKSPMATSFLHMCILRGLPAIIEEEGAHNNFSEEEFIASISRLNPWAVINTVGFNKIDDAEQSPRDCYRENTLLPVELAQICRVRGIRMLTMSTDQVFNGKKQKPYLEADKTDPLNVYGMSKKLAEESILFTNPEVLIVRSGLLMNPLNEDDFLMEVLFKNDAHINQYHVSDIIVSPAYLPDVINTALDLLIDGERGIWHLSGPEAISYYDFVRLAIGIAGKNDSRIHSVPSSHKPTLARRPSYSALRSDSGILLPKLDLSIANYLVSIQQIGQSIK